MIRYHPLKRHKVPREIIRLAVRCYCRYPLSCRGVQDMLAEWGIIFDGTVALFRCGQVWGDVGFPDHAPAMHAAATRQEA